MTGRTIPTLIRSYEEGARRAAERKRLPVPNVPDKLVDHQVSQAKAIVQLLKHDHTVAILGDPVGTGKTVIALAAALRMLEAGTVERVAVIAPNGRVKRIWQDRVEYFGLPELAKSIDVYAVGSIPAWHTKPTLVIVDEAHRRLHRDRLASFIKTGGAAPHRRLFLTATPFQISVEDFAALVGLGDNVGTTADVQAALQSYGQAITRVARHLRFHGGEAPDTTVLQAAAKRWEDHQDRIFCPLPTESELARIGIAAPPPLKASQAVIPIEGAWSEAFHVARLAPEIRKDQANDARARAADSFQRGLCSSSEMFWTTPAAKMLPNHIERPLRRALGTGTDHPKVRATVEQVATWARTGQHVGVFCVWEATAKALQEALEAELGDGVVARPDSKISTTMEQRFRTLGADPLVLILQERFSESIDLDGGQPALVHHDLPWNPAKLRQRWGRFVRAGSGFEPIPPDRIFVPVLDHETDLRVFNTVNTRSGIADVLLSQETVLADGDQGEVPETDIGDKALEILHRYRV